MKKSIFIISVFLIAFSISVLAQTVSITPAGNSQIISPSPKCVVPQDGQVFSEDTILCSGTYYLPNGLKIHRGENMTFDCNGAKLVGPHNNYTHGVKGIESYVSENIVIKDCTITNYNIALYLLWPKNNTVINNSLYDSYYGIYAALQSSNNYFLYNNLTNNSNGIRFEQTENNTFAFNRVINNTRGLETDDVGGINITKNLFSGNNLGFNIVNTWKGPNNIWLNEVWDVSNVWDELNNNYCVNGRDNNYMGNSTGPHC